MEDSEVALCDVELLVGKAKVCIDEVLVGSCEFEADRVLEWLWWRDEVVLLALEMESSNSCSASNSSISAGVKP